jgi:uncharacterized protein YuzE
MKINYDKIADAAYLTFNEGKIEKTIQTEDRIIIDLDKNENIVGIEILDFSSNKVNLENLQKNVQDGVPVNIVSGTPVTV